MPLAFADHSAHGFPRGNTSLLETCEQTNGERDRRMGWFDDSDDGPNDNDRRGNVVIFHRSINGLIDRVLQTTHSRFSKRELFTLGNREQVPGGRSRPNDP